MKLVRPLGITDAILASSNVPETDYTAFSAATTYAIGDRVRWVASDSHRIYESLVASNLNNAPETLSTSSLLVAVGNRSLTVGTGLGFAGGQAVELTALADPTATMTGTVTSYTSGTGALVLNITAVTGGGLYAVWVIKRPNLWLEISATNRWQMFDKSVTSQTSNANSIAVTLTPGTRLSTLALLNVAAATAQVTVTDAVDGVVYNQTRNLVYLEGITDWYSYFFDPIQRMTDVVFDGLPMYSNPTIVVTLTNTGNTVKCGALVAGLGKDIGGTQYGASLGIQDFSVKQRDDFGNFAVLQRAYAKRGRFTVMVDNTTLDAVTDLLATYRATPVVYIGSDLYTSTFIYGFFKDFSCLINYPSVSLLDIEIEGLT